MVPKRSKLEWCMRGMWSMTSGTKWAMLQDVLYADTAVWAKLCHRPFLISHPLVNILCSCCDYLWRGRTVKNISIFCCDLADELGRDWIPPVLLCKPTDTVGELYIHRQLAFHFLWVLILQSWLLVLLWPSFAICGNYGLGPCLCSTFGS